MSYFSSDRDRLLRRLFPWRRLTRKYRPGTITLIEPLEQMPAIEVPSAHVIVPVIYEDHLPEMPMAAQYELPAPMDVFELPLAPVVGLSAVVAEHPSVPARVLGLEQEFVPNPAALEIADAVQQVQMTPGTLPQLGLEGVIASPAELVPAQPITPQGAPSPEPMPEPFPDRLFMG